MFRGGGSVDWQRDWVLPHGVLASGTASATVDVYQVWDNPDMPDGVEIARRCRPSSAELRWPWSRTHRRRPST